LLSCQTIVGVWNWFWCDTVERTNRATQLSRRSSQVHQEHRKERSQRTYIPHSTAQTGHSGRSQNHLCWRWKWGQERQYAFARDRGTSSPSPPFCPFFTLLHRLSAGPDHPSFLVSLFLAVRVYRDREPCIASDSCQFSCQTFLSFTASALPLQALWVFL
jgi:hypothetical protein